MHDFRQLSPLDFENFVRDLLQEELKLRIESFGPGKDGGIDFRFAQAGKKTIVQVKHYVESPPRSLVRAAVKENEKIARLKADRYIFVTSAGLSPALKEQIIEAMPNAPLAHEDVIGREDLNNLLQRHPKILRQHFKLWLTNTETLDRIVHSGIYNRTDAELEQIKSLVPRFVQNSSVADAEKILEARGALIIAGEPGVGKTTLARVVTWLHLEQGWRVFVVDDLKEAMDVCTVGDKRLIFLDDFLGQISLTNDAIRNVDQRLPIFLDRVRNNKDLRFVLTTRRYLLTQAQQQSARLSSEKVIASELILNVGAYTRSIRAQIVYNHIYFSSLSAEEKKSLLRDNFYLKMIDHPNFSPRLIDLLTTADYQMLQGAPIEKVVLNVLNNPAELWETPYRAHLTEDSRVVMLALFFSDYSVPVEKLMQSFRRISNALGIDKPDSTVVARFRQALKPLEGSVTSHSNGNVYFSNPGLQDFLSNVIIEDHLLPAVVRASQTYNELSNAWDFYEKHVALCRPHMPGEDIWSKALSRLISAGESTAVRIVLLGITICNALDDNKDILQSTEQALQCLRLDAIDSNDEHYCRHALELYQNLSMEAQKFLPSISLLVEATADMLGSCGDQLSLDEIEILARAIEVYGEKPRLAKTAANAAMSGLLTELSERLYDISSIDELESFEYNLTRALTKFDLAFDTSAKTKMVEHREYLEQKEAEEEDDGYKPVTRSPRDSEVSDADIKSLFTTLIEAQERE